MDRKNPTRTVQRRCFPAFNVDFYEIRGRVSSLKDKIIKADGLYLDRSSRG